MTPRTPTTAAGRALLADPDNVPPELLAIRILAIEDEAEARAPSAPPETLGVERIAAFLHDEYGCRITCRGGRLADDRHPSHNEAYLDQAERLRAALEEPTPSLDVERLARALQRVIDNGDALALFREDAEAIAREYAREYALEEPTP